MKLLTFLFLFAPLASLFAQESKTPATKPEYFQIFLEKPVKKVIKVEYMEEGKGPIKFKLSDDGTAIYLLDYDESGGVKAEVVNMDNADEEVTRSKCYIHSLPNL